MATKDSTPGISTAAGRKHKIDTPAARAALAQANNPYFAPFAGVPHAALGFRKTAHVGEPHGTWVARLRVQRDDGTTGYEFKALDDVRDVGRHAYHAATKAAQAWFDLRTKGPVNTEITVAMLADDYCKAMATTTMDDKPPRSEAAHALRLQHENWITGRKNDKGEVLIKRNPIADVPLVKLAKAHVRAWRNHLEATPDNHGKQRSKMSINRELNSLRCVLNWGKDELELVRDDSAWKKVLKVIKGAARARDLYLDAAERKALLAAMEPQAVPLFKSVLLVPLRPGIAAKLQAGWFAKKLSMLTVGDQSSSSRAERDKTNKATGRQLILPPETAAFFAKHTKDKLPGARIFMRDDGKAWTPREWCRAIRIAREKAFPVGSKAHRKCSAYTLRHCAITDLVRAGVPLSKVADLAGTSVVEIEKHYKHLVPADTTQGLAVLAAGMRM